MNNGIIAQYIGMPIIKVCCTLGEFSDYIKPKLTDEHRNKFNDCTFAPLKLHFREEDMSIEALIVPVKNY